MEKINRSRVCEYKPCSKEYQRDQAQQKFCSRTCAAKYNNMNRAGLLSPVLCTRCLVFCGTGRIFCSEECRVAYPVERWLAGELDATNKYGMTAFARRYILERAEYQCEAIDSRTELRCTENRNHPITGNTVLNIDHKDGNWRNNWPDNLRALCPTCHALTENYGALNMGNGRTWKKDYKQYVPMVQ